MSGVLTDAAEVLLRQIHPDFFDKGEPASNRFCPSKRDENQLSVDRSSIHSAADSHALYTADGAKSAAVFGLSIGEFQAEKIECRDDPTVEKPAIEDKPPQKANPAHALANYDLFDVKTQKLIAIRLRQLAIKRGAMFIPD